MRIPFLAVVFAFLLFSSFPLLSTAASQQLHPLQAEFERDARQAWQDLAQASFDNCAVAWDFQHTVKLGTPEENTYEVSNFKFARNGFRNLEFVRTKNGTNKTYPVGTSRGYAANNQYCFEVDRVAEDNWQILSVEMLDESLAYEAKPINLVSRSPSSVSDQVRHQFELDQRLLITSSGSRLEQLLQKKGLLFLDPAAELVWSERVEPIVGRVIRLEFSADSDRTDASLRRPGSRFQRTTMEGSIEFIADYFWCLYQLDYVNTAYPKDGSPAVKRTVQFRSEYTEAGGVEIPSKIERIEMGRSPNKEVYLMRPMTKEEIGLAEKRCYLSGYGLPEPKGVKLPWPKWVWFAILGGGAICLSAIFKFFLGRKS